MGLYRELFDEAREAEDCGDMQRLFSALVDLIARRVRERVEDHPDKRFYLYYRPARGVDPGFALPVADDECSPDGYVLACPCPVPSDVPLARGELREWVRDRMKVLPILPPERRIP